MHEVITRILDDDEFLEVQAGYAQNIIVGFGRIDGRSVGIVANQPTQFAGCLDINASEKAARFIRTCDCFGIPIITLEDVPGFLPGTEQEYNGIIRRGAKLLYAYGEATVPKITVITRKAYGGAYDVMGSSTWVPTSTSHGPPRRSPSWAHRVPSGSCTARSWPRPPRTVTTWMPCAFSCRRSTKTPLVNPYIAAERGYVDAVIPPSHTRGYIATSLRLLDRKIVRLPPKKHGNIPL